MALIDDGKNVFGIDDNDGQIHGTFDLFNGGVGLKAADGVGLGIDRVQIAGKAVFG